MLQVAFLAAIAALGETGLAEEDSFKERGGFTFFWKGKPETEDKIHGVGFAIRTALLKDINSLPVGANECLMTVSYTHLTLPTTASV